LALQPRQLSLPIERIREPTLEEFLPGPNAEAVAAVTASAAGRGEPFLFLFGHPGTGKSHLLQAASRAAGQSGRQARFLPLGDPDLAPGLLDRLDGLDLVAVDDLDRIAGRPDWEHALFGLFNRLRERGRTLLTAAAGAPETLGLGLPDLVSRLQWGPRYRLLPLSEADCEALLAESAQRRGFRLGPEVVRYIMTYHARDPAALVELVARLDTASLREQRRPTIPMVRQVMRGEGHGRPDLG
jgi:DnaA family protein